MSDKKLNKKLPSKVDEHICFAIYSATHAFGKAYNPLLKKLGLTYPQYMALTVLWENDGVTVGEMCKQLHLDSSTLTPLLKRLEKLGHIIRKRGAKDERQVFVSLTPSGTELQSHAAGITKCIVAATQFDVETLQGLVETISVLRDNITDAAS
jgi:DNA-binding MarR family transcriptional regulator